MAKLDAVVVGAGPNGLAAAIVLALAGRTVLVREAMATPGGAVRSDSLTLPGFLHDVCSSVYPLGIASPFFRRLPLRSFGLEWVHPPVPLAHPFDDGTAAVLECSLDSTGRGLGADGEAWVRLMRPFVERWQTLYTEILGPLHVPRDPILLARFGMVGVLASTRLVRALFKERNARALFAGIAAHATLPLSQPPSATFGLVLGIAGHAVGWPFARGGAGAITNALVSYLRALGGKLDCDAPVRRLEDLPDARAAILDVTAPQLLAMAGDRLPSLYRAQLRRFQPGLGTFKVDWALDRPIPWKADECTRAGTVHLGGTLEEVATSQEDAWAGRVSDRPFVLLAQPSLFDSTRAPEGKHTAWAYCHVPYGSSADMTDRIEAQVERFAPGFRDRIIGRHTMGPAELEAHDPNIVGGDINGGESTLLQLFFRPAIRPVPYATPLPDVFLCSSSTPPGGAVHGMCGYHAARVALRHRF